MRIRIQLGMMRHELWAAHPIRRLGGRCLLGQQRRGAAPHPLTPGFTMSNRRSFTYSAIMIVPLAIVVWLICDVQQPPPERRAVPAGASGRSAPAAEGDAGRMVRGVVGSREVDEWTLRFGTGAEARIWIQGEDRSRLDCVAQDAAGNLLDADADTTGRCYLAWEPSHSGGYRIMIRNAGSAPTAYRLVAR
ncbi:MAG TPA: hypothetical protein VF746_03380 [Longimicrobium sp.]